MTLNGMYRIKAEDADALGEDKAEDAASEDPNAEPANEEAVLDALRKVFDPEIPVNVVDLGLIYKVSIENDDEGKRVALVDMTLTALVAGWAPSSPRMPKALSTSCPA